MDLTLIVLKAMEMIPKVLPRSKPPAVDYSQLIEAVPKSTPIASHTPAPVSISPIPVRREVTPVTSGEGTQQTGCISCSRSHLSTVSGALGESLRFAREGGITHPEVQRRVLLSEDEINIMERIDLSAEAIAISPPEERQLAEEFLPKIRALRQDLGTVSSLEKLEEVAADASVLSQEFRLRHLQLQGVDLNPVVELAKRVEAGEISMSEAKEKLRELLPEEE